MNPSRYFSIIGLLFLAALGLLAAYGKAEAISPPPVPLKDGMEANNPPVEQALVPEGIFAIQLVQALKMGQAQDEAQAENMLSSVGIEPNNGWIAGYPVTPPIVGEIEKGVISAAEAGRLRMEKEEALKAVEFLEIKLGLNVTPAAASAQLTAPQPVPSSEPGNTIIYKYTDKSGVIHFTDRYESIPKEYRGGVEMIQEAARPRLFAGPADEGIQPPGDDYIPNPGPEVIDNYYYDYGPPVVTYYEPPAPYGYLYAWVPYPFWCSGFYFSGFFILHDFHRHGFFHRRPFVVTNHVVVKKRVRIVDPGSRKLRASTRPKRIPSHRGFNSPKVQPSARTIVGVTHKRAVPATVPTPSRISRAIPPHSMGKLQGSNRQNPRVFHEPARPPGNKFQAPGMAGGRTFRPPAANGRPSNLAPPRVSYPAAPSQSRNFSSPAPRGRGSFEGFRQNGFFSGYGRSFGGGGRSHR